MKYTNKKHKQVCIHDFFYTMGNTVYCNSCHKILGYFDPVEVCGFVKQTKDSIADKHLNERTKKIDIKD